MRATKGRRTHNTNRKKGGWYAREIRGTDRDAADRLQDLVKLVLQTVKGETIEAELQETVKKLSSNFQAAFGRF